MMLLEYCYMTANLTSFLLLTVGACWALWWWWKFTIQPKLWPEDPRPLPYSLPWVGSAIAFFQDSYAVINSGISAQLAREPFTLTLAGEQIYVVTNPKDVAEVYKNNTSLSFDVFISDLMLSCGATKETVDKMNQAPPPYPTGSSASSLNPENKSLIRLAIDFHHLQLLQGPNSHADEITDTFLGHIDNFLQWDVLLNDERLLALTTAESMQVSLLKLCGRVLIEAGTRTYWGVRLWELEPDMLSSFYELDRGIWKILFQYPKMFSKEVLAVRDNITETLAAYYRLPKETRQDAAWFTESMETESREAGLDENEMAAAIMIIYFVVNGNTYKFCFWALCHILSDPSLFTSIRTEVSRQYLTTPPTIDHLTNHCPLLHSTLSEVLRLYTSSASMRYIATDTPIGKHILRAGRKIMIPYRPLHEHTAVWGSDALAFNSKRFLHDKSLKRNASYRPFGGGATLCAGRFAAMQEVLSFIGLTLHRYDIELARRPDGMNQAFPRVDGMKPTFGMMGPIEGDDYIVKVTKR